MPQITERWIPKRGKAGKTVPVRNPLRGMVETVVQPGQIAQIYPADRALLFKLDSDGSLLTMRAADLRRHWKKEPAD